MKENRSKMKLAKNQNGLTAIDAVLIVLIVGSLGFIGWRMMNRTKPAPEAEPVHMATSPPPPVATPFVDPRLNAPPPSSEPNATPRPKLAVIDDSAWQQVMANPVMKAARVKRADGCSNVFPRPVWGFSTPNPDRIRQTRQGIPQTISALRIPLCFETGQTFNIVSFSTKPDAPVVSYIGTARVTDVISIELKKIPDEFFLMQGQTRAGYEAYIASKKTLEPGTRDNLVRIQPIAPVTPPPGTVPAILERGSILYAADFKKFIQQYPNALIIDVRSPQEFGARRIPNSKNVPFTPGPSPETRFAWTTRNRDLANSDFNIAPILNQAKNRFILVVGAGPQDGRAFWAMRSIDRFKLDQTAMLYEGADTVR